MRQPGALVVARVHHDLCLAGQPAEGGGVHDPVAVPLEARPLGVRGLGDRAVAGALGEGGAAPEGLALALLAELTVDDRARADLGPGARVGPDECAARMPGHGLRPRLRAG
jgi:hypothetical protein